MIMAAGYFGNLVSILGIAMLFRERKKERKKDRRIHRKIYRKEQRHDIGCHSNAVHISLADYKKTYLIAQGIAAIKLIIM